MGWEFLFHGCGVGLGYGGLATLLVDGLHIAVGIAVGSGTRTVVLRSRVAAVSAGIWLVSSIGVVAIVQAAGAGFHFPD